MTTATKTYTTEITETAAPKKGKDLLLKIDVGDDHATIHCLGTEKAGDHMPRCVWFHANKACTLHFDPPLQVFGKKNHNLKGHGNEERLDIVTPAGETEWTYCYVTPLGAPCPITEHKSPPRIEVP